MVVLRRKFGKSASHCTEEPLVVYVTLIGAVCAACWRRGRPICNQQVATVAAGTSRPDWLATWGVGSGCHHAYRSRSLIDVKLCPPIRSVISLVRRRGSPLPAPTTHYRHSSTSSLQICRIHFTYFPLECLATALLLSNFGHFPTLRGQCFSTPKRLFH